MANINTKSKGMFPLFGPHLNPAEGPWNSFAEADAFFASLGIEPDNIMVGTEVQVIENGVPVRYVRTVNGDWARGAGSIADVVTEKEHIMFGGIVEDDIDTLLPSTTQAAADYQIYYVGNLMRFVAVIGGKMYGSWADAEKWCDTESGSIPYEKKVYVNINTGRFYLGRNGELITSSADGGDIDLEEIKTQVEQAQEDAYYAKRDSALAKEVARDVKIAGDEIKQALADFSASGDINQEAIGNIALLRGRAAAIESLLRIDYNEPTPTPPSGGEDSGEDEDFELDVESNVRFYYPVDNIETGLARGKEGEVIAFKNTGKSCSHYYTGIPSGATKVTSISTYLPKNTESYTNFDGEQETNHFPYLVFVGEGGLYLGAVYDNNLGAAAVSKTYEQEISIPDGAVGVYVNCYTWTAEGYFDNNKVVGVTFARKLNALSSYDMSLNQRDRARYITSGGVWNSAYNSKNMFHVMLGEVVPGATYLVKASATNDSRIAFMTSPNNTDKSEAQFCLGTTRESVELGGEKSFVAPADAKYLYVQVGNSSRANLPQSITEYFVVGDAGEDDVPEIPEVPEVSGSGSGLVDDVNTNKVKLAEAYSFMNLLSARLRALENAGGAAKPDGDASGTVATEALNACMAMYAKVGIVGTSWDSGRIYSDPNMTFVNAAQRKDLSWPAIMGRRNGISVYNYAMRDANTRTWLSNSACMAALEAGPLCDVYILGLMGNDASDLGDSYLGSINDITDNYVNNPDTFFGNYAKIIERILKRHSDAGTQVPKIIMIARTPDREGTTVRGRYAKAVAEICAHYGFPAPMNWYDDAWYTNWCTKVGYWGSHPSAAQCSGMALCFERLYSKMVAENKDYFWDFLGCNIHTGYTGSITGNTNNK